IGGIDNDELVDNYAVGNNPAAAVNGAKDAFGDESFNARLTLVWEPTDDFSAKLKYSYSDYENDGGWMWSDTLCPEGSAQYTAVPSASAAFRVFPNVDDCKINGNTSRIFLNEGLRGGLPWGYDDGVPGLEQETDFVSLTMNWDINENYSLQSVTGYVDFNHIELDDYSHGAGVFGGLHNNVYESLSQEFRLSSQFDGSLNFQIGLYWQDIDQDFDAHQYAFNLGVMPNIFGAAYALVGGDPTATIIGPDPTTGNMYDYNKRHVLESDVVSAYLALYWDVTDSTEVTVGARWTDEEKEGYIQIPYVHAGALLFGFGGPPLIDGLEFEDDNISPEIAINHHLNDDISVYVSYKEGFKSGGIDNSALPTAALNPAVNGGDFGFLIYDSEVSDGFEIGMKGNFLGGAMRLNATVFTYEYTDLQVQLFDSNTIQFQTFNASALETKGLEFDMMWHTDIEGLIVRSAWAWTNVEYTEDFINATGENLKGQDGAGSADIAGNVGFTYDMPLGDNWRLSVSADARFTDEYPWTATADPYIQDSFWLLDAAISVYSEDQHHEFSLIGKNLADEIYSVGGGNTPGRCPNIDFSGAFPTCNSSGANSLDQVAYTPLGRTVSLRYKYTL
ncbi:MAG: TonB-dependent receptor, partial [Gammaproteobacteria bacterium]|nr:TonB-dependent receptor [Gammaproteobacteria bacterium]